MRCFFGYQVTFLLRLNPFVDYSSTASGPPFPHKGRLTDTLLSTAFCPLRMTIRVDFRFDENLFYCIREDNILPYGKVRFLYSL